MPCQVMLFPPLPKGLGNIWPANPVFRLKIFLSESTCLNTLNWIWEILEHVYRRQFLLDMAIAPEKRGSNIRSSLNVPARFESNLVWGFMAVIFLRFWSRLGSTSSKGTVGRSYPLFIIFFENLLVRNYRSVLLWSMSSSSVSAPFEGLWAIHPQIRHFHEKSYCPANRL